MNVSAKNRISLSLIQTLTAIFITITVLVTVLAVTSVKGIDRIGLQFSHLSERTLPLATNNALLTQNILEQVKYIGYSTRAKDNRELESVKVDLSNLEANMLTGIEEMKNITEEFGDLIDSSLKDQLTADIAQFSRYSSSILSSQELQINQLQKINELSSGFRYGLSSIGPEMNRISSFLAVDNPESMDAANRFVAAASVMESTFLMLMMQEELEAAKKEFKELNTRVSGLELAFDDFKEWHPDVEEFASLTAPYQMVLDGFKEGGILDQTMIKLDTAQNQNQDFNETALLADKITAQLRQLSDITSNIINDKETEEKERRGRRRKGNQKEGRQVKRQGGKRKKKRKRMKRRRGRRRKRTHRWTTQK